MFCTIKLGNSLAPTSSALGLQGIVKNGKNKQRWAKDKPDITVLATQLIVKEVWQHGPICVFRKGCNST